MYTARDSIGYNFPDILQCRNRVLSFLVDRTGCDPAQETFLRFFVNTLPGPDTIAR